MAVLDVHHPFQMWLSYGLMDGPIEETKPTNNNKHWGQSSHDQSGINPNEEDKINWNEDVSWVWWNLLKNTQKIHGRRKKKHLRRWNKPHQARKHFQSSFLPRPGRPVIHLSEWKIYPPWFSVGVYFPSCSAYNVVPPPVMFVGLYPHQLVRYIYHKS